MSAPATIDSTAAPEVLRGHRVWLWAALALFPIVAAVIAAQQGAEAWQLRLGDPDNYLRLAQVRDWLGGQSWWEVTQHRVDPPDGLRTHWSRLADLPYGLPIALLSLIVSTETAERLAIVAVPPLLLLATMIATARIGDRLAGWRGAVCACLIIALSPQILAQFVPGRLDHHGLQLLLLISALAAAVGRDSHASGVGAAACAALSLAVGLETAPYLAALAIWFAVRWVLRGGDTRAKTIGFAAGIAIFVPLVAAATIPQPEWTAQRHDAIGRGHVLAALLGGGGFAAALSGFRSDTRLSRLAQAAAGALAALVAVAIFPEVARAPYSEVDPLLQRIWIGRLSETRSFLDHWRAGPLEAIGRVAFLTATTAAAILLIVRPRGEDRDNCLLVGVLVLTAWPLFLWQIRAVAPATMVAVPAAAAALAQFWRDWSKGGSVLPFAAALLLLNPIAPAALFRSADALVSGGRNASRPDRAASAPCDLPEHFRGLAGAERGLILSPIDLSATLLVRTPHSVITAGNHRNAEANRRAYRTLAAPTEAARSWVRETGADYVVFCPTAAEVRNFVRFAPNSLLASLRAGRTPAWLAEVPEASRANLRVYAVRRERGGERSGSPVSTAAGRGSKGRR